MMRALAAGLALALLGIGARAAVAPWDGEEDPASALAGGDWDARMRAVHRLGARGAEGRSALKAALADPDWQVRLSALHLLGRAGEGESLLEALARERCPLVRLSAAHWLGTSAGPGDARRLRGEQLKDCESWPWPATAEFRRGRHWEARTAEVTRPDAAGCRYIHYRRLGRALCPEGTVVRGVGLGPGEAKFLAKKPPPSGVALCCPPAAATTDSAPVKAECRLHPIECPAGWAEMEPPSDDTARRPTRYRRTRRMVEGDIDWIHCCRLPEEPPPAEEDEAAARPPGPEDGPQAPPPAEDEPQAAPPGPGAGGVSVDLRLEQLDFLLAEVADLGPPARAPRRVEPPVAAEPETSPAPERSSGEPGLESGATPGERGELGEPEPLPRREETPLLASAALAPAQRDRPQPALSPAGGPHGARGHLGRPQVPVRSEGRVSAPAELMPDAGRPDPAHDPFPALLAALQGGEPLKRARAAEMLATLGVDRPEAVPALLDALSDPNARVRAAAALALGRASRGDEAVKLLRRALRDRDPDVRYSAAEALGRIGTPAARRAFAGHLRHESALFIRGRRE